MRNIVSIISLSHNLFSQGLSQSLGAKAKISAKFFLIDCPPGGAFLGLTRNLNMGHTGPGGPVCPWGGEVRGPKPINKPVSR